MFKKLLNKKLLKNQKGLTLIELLAVIVILAIVAAIAIPAIGNIINNSKDKAILADASSLLAGAKIAITDGACGAEASGVITCNKDALTDVFEGKLAEGDQVAFNTTSKKYTITFAHLAGIKNTKKFTIGTSYVPPATTITEEDLKSAMGK